MINQYYDKFVCKFKAVILSKTYTNQAVTACSFAAR